MAYQVNCQCLLRLIRVHSVFLLLGGLGLQANASPWWKDRPLRIYHPNMRELEAEHLDVDQFISDCKSLHAEAVVFSTGGIVAFYQSQVPHHVKSPHMQARDLLQEVTEAARAQGTKVIARFDFSKARPDLFASHPEWFYQDKDGNPLRTRNGLFRTTMLGAYQNEAFALPALREVLTRYQVAGFHLNAPGFGGSTFNARAMRTYNIPMDKQHQRQWREQRLADQMMRYRRSIQQHSPDALFMAEINSPESPGWGTSRGFNHERLAGAYTNLLSTAGKPEDDDLYRFRWWVGLTADWSHASKSETSGLPIINLKVGHHKGKLSLKPVDEYAFYCYQAIAHNAGIKAPTYGLLHNMPDPRTRDMIAPVFRLMERCAPYMTSADRIAPVALIWPADQEGMGIEGSWRNEMLGLYRGLLSSHILFEVVLSHRLPQQLSQRFQTIVLPSATMLNDSQIRRLITFVRSGGRLVLLDAPSDKPMPKALAEQLGIKPQAGSFTRAYAVPNPSVHPRPPGPILLSQPIRCVGPPANARVWYYTSPTPGGSHIPEFFPVIEPGDSALLFSRKIGKGSVAYFAGSLGSMMWKNDLPDYREILTRMIESDSKRLLTTDAPDTVNVTAYRVRPGVALHWVNGTGSTPLDKTVQVGPIRVRLRDVRGKRARWYTPDIDGDSLACHTHASFLDIVIPKLNAYGLLVVEE